MRLPSIGSHPLPGVPFAQSRSAVLVWVGYTSDEMTVTQCVYSIAKCVCTMEFGVVYPYLYRVRVCAFNGSVCVWCGVGLVASLCGWCVASVAALRLHLVLVVE
jgi:hypothetical protein